MNIVLFTYRTTKVIIRNESKYNYQHDSLQSHIY